MTQPQQPVAPPPQPYAAPGGAMQAHRGTMILVFGILSWVCCVILGIIAWVMGSGDLKKMDAGQMDPSGRGMTKAGMILGMIHVIVSIVAVVIYLIILVIALASQQT